MKTYHVTTASGTDVTVHGDRAELDEQTGAVTIYDGDSVAGSFRGYTSFWTQAPEE